MGAIAIGVVVFALGIFLLWVLVYASGVVRPKVTTERIRVREELGAPRHVTHHPFTDPCSRAAMTWRWKTMNSSSVGTRMRIVPALRSGMSVA